MNGRALKSLENLNYCRAWVILEGPTPVGQGMEDAPGNSEFEHYTSK